MVDRFEDLRTFTTVISCGGINTAATELGIAKSAVSRRISDMEKRLGTALVDRSTRRFQPTAVGAEYARRAAALLRSLEELDGSAAAAGSDPIVSISAPPAMLVHLLIPALASRMGDLERTSIRFIDQRAGAGPHTADIVVSHANGSGAHHRHLRAAQTVSCAAPDYLERRGTPSSPGDLRDHDIIASDAAPHAEWRNGKSVRQLSAVTIIAPDEDAAASAAVAGLGLVQLPDYVVAVSLADRRLVRVLEPFDPPPSAIIATFPQDASLAVRRIVDGLARSLG